MRSKLSRQKADLSTTLAKIADAVSDGQDGSAAYALDRLRLIGNLVGLAALKLARFDD